VYVELRDARGKLRARYDPDRGVLELVEGRKATYFDLSQVGASLAGQPAGLAPQPVLVENDQPARPRLAVLPRRSERAG
jgi:hypothetical protein